MKKIFVIGAGVNGLSSAVKIAEHFYRQNVQVVLVSEDTSPNTTGDVSAGLWGPYLIAKTPEEKIVYVFHLIIYRLSLFCFNRQWSKSSHDFFLQLWSDGLAEEAGISMIPVYHLTSDLQGLQVPSWKGVVLGFRSLSSGEIAKLQRDHKQKYTDGIHFISFCCEPTKFLPYLMKRFLAAGGRFEQRKVQDFNDGFDDADLIINCAGLGSKKIANDGDSYAVRGQIARVKAPWIKEVVLQMDDDGNYVIPNTDCVILGGTHQVNDNNLEVSPIDSTAIFTGCKKIIPSIKNVETIKEMVGLRPGRDAVRLEIEWRDSKPTVIHNYGHGGSGVTLCWGCSDEVLEKSIQTLRLPGNVSKL